MHASIQIAESILRNSFGERLTLQPEALWDGHKNTVVRCRVQQPMPFSAPESVIVKHAKIGTILADWAAAQFLTTIPHHPPFAPDCYGGDLASQTLVLEDLGPGDAPNTYDLLMGDDPAAAATALIEHMQLLGQLHAATQGQVEEYMRIRRGLGPLPAPQAIYHDPWPDARDDQVTEDQRRQAIQTYRDRLRAVDLLAASAVADEIELISTQVEAQPETFLAFCQGDVNMPGNCVRCGGQLRLYDFDCGGFRHALTEGLAGRLTWGCVLRIPPDILHKMDTAYRMALSGGRAEAHDDRQYAQALAEAAGRWHIFHLIGRLPTALGRDYQRGPTSLRQQFLAWLEAFAAISEAAGHLTALGQVARRLAGRLRTRWPAEVAALPYYPAFRG
jgi:hypothetical protein